MAIPAHTSRVHLMPYWKGDSPAAINRAGRNLGRRRVGYVDINFSVCTDGVVGLHWPTAAKNGYRFLQVGKRRRAMTRHELNRPIGDWKTADVLRWRRTKRRGLSYSSRIRPYTFGELIRIAKRRRVVICAELKSRRFATDPDVAKAMVAAADAEGVVVFPMCLVTMWGWGQKMRNFHQAGFETALLAHGARKPADLAKWRPFISVVWGRFR